MKKKALDNLIILAIIIISIIVVILDVQITTGEEMFAIHSKAFKHDQMIPRKHSGQGEDISPELTWVNPPKETKEFALICEDPDAPTPEPWIHWVIYKIPATETTLPEGIPQTASLSNPTGALQGKNSWGTIGYRGPLPPHGSGDHHYYFTLYALNAPLQVKAGLEKEKLLKAIEEKTLSKVTLIGTYKR